MWRLLKKMLMFRLGQKASRGFARRVGINRLLANFIGVIGGMKSMRRHP